jgi:hypothetical protein
MCACVATHLQQRVGRVLGSAPFLLGAREVEVVNGDGRARKSIGFKEVHKQIDQRCFATALWR